MFKKLKDKIAEEVKSSPNRIQQIVNVSKAKFKLEKICWRLPDFFFRLSHPNFHLDIFFAQYLQIHFEIWLFIRRRLWALPV